MVYLILKNVKLLLNCNKMELYCLIIFLKINISLLLLGKNFINFVFFCKICFYNG